MKNRFLKLTVLAGLILSSCSTPATATANPIDIQGTAQAAASTIIAGTQTAIPTNTSIPPTETLTETPLPTETLLPSPTVEALTATPTQIPTFTPQPTVNMDQCNKILTSWKVTSKSFNVVNDTKPTGTVVLSMFVVTAMGECGYLPISGDSFEGPVGQYSAGAYVTGEKNFKVFGGFTITDTAEWKIVILNDKIIAAYSCYPHC